MGYGTESVLLLFVVSAAAAGLCILYGATRQLLMWRYQRIVSRRMRDDWKVR